MPCVTPPGVSLLGAALSALGSAAVVPDVTSEVHGHSCVTAVNSYHGYLLSRWPMGQAQVADVGLWGQKEWNWSALSLRVADPDLPYSGSTYVTGEAP